MTQTAVSMETIRQAALDHLRAGLLHAGVDQAWKYLRQRQDDHEVREELIGALNRLGLGALGAYLANGCQGDTGAIAWGKRASVWSANLKALQSRLPGLAAQLRQHWNSCRQAFELFECPDGNYQIRWLEERGLGLWLPCFADHRRAAEQVRPPQGNFAAGNCLMIYGIGPGWLINRAYRSTEKVFLDFSCCIHVLAPSAAELAAAMHLHDWQAVLADRRVLLFVGSDCLEQEERFLGANPLYPVPAWRMIQATWDGSRVAEVPQAIQRIADHREGQTRRSAEALVASYAGRDVAYWAARYARRASEPLRVLGIVSRHSTFIRGSMAHCLAALEALGHRTRKVTEAEPFFLGHSARELHQHQLEFQPDLILMVDNYRSQMPGMLTPNVPVMMWIQDALGRLICPEAGRAMGPLDFVMGYARSECLERCDYPPDGFLECDVPTGFEGRSEMDPELEKRHTCDVSFISTASKPPEQIHRERRDESPPELWPLIDAIYEEVRGYLGEGLHICNPKTFLERMMAETGVEVSDVTARQDLETWYVFRLFDWGFRQEALRWTAEWARRTGRSFRLYGRGWESFPDLEEFARGHLWEREEVATVHRCSKINLQLFALTALHQRTYDILGAGGFPLVRRSPVDYRDEDRARVRAFLSGRPPGDLRREENRPLARLVRTHLGPLEQVIGRLEQGDDLFPKAVQPDVASRYPALREVTFDSAESLAERLEFYLAHPEARLDRARKLREAILAQATYQARMGQALDFISRRLRLRAKYGCRGLPPRRGPETVSSASVLVFRTDFSSRPSGGGAYLGQIEEQLIRGIAEASASCKIVRIEKCSPPVWEERIFELLEKHEPDGLVSFQRPVILRRRGCVPAKQLVVGYGLTGAQFDIARQDTVRYGALVNAAVPELYSRKACQAWTGLAADRVRGWWMPWAAGAAVKNAPGVDGGADGDLSVRLLAPAPAEEMVEQWRENRTSPLVELAGALGRLVRRREDILQDPSCLTPAGLDGVCDDLVGTDGPEPGSQAWRFLRYWCLPRMLEIWYQQGWLERLAEWARARELSLRVFAMEAWRAHPQLGQLVVPFEQWETAGQARLHLGFASAAIPPAPDMAVIAARTPTLLWRSPNWPANGEAPRAGAEEALCPTLVELAPEAKKLTFADWQELTERIEAHLADPGPLTESTQGTADAVAEHLSTQSVIHDLVSWVLTG